MTKKNMDDLKDENARLRSALTDILDQMQDSPLLNEMIVDEYRRGKHNLELKIGGDQANISVWVAIAQIALGK